ncbi:MAG: DUF1876 domain-containing protein [Mycobacterium sp.]|nr:DUF1876 domain-containing protein [Mycobacterium sp.]
MDLERPDTLKHWTVTVSIDERDGHTRAKARLCWRDKESVGFGAARCNPADRDISDIGDELAVARALRDLAGQLLAATGHDIEASTHQPVTSLH